MSLFNFLQVYKSCVALRQSMQVTNELVSDLRKTVDDSCWATLKSRYNVNQFIEWSSPIKCAVQKVQD